MQSQGSIFSLTTWIKLGSRARLYEYGLTLPLFLRIEYDLLNLHRVEQLIALKSIA